MSQEISGYAAVFNSETIIAGAFRERIAHGAFSETLKRDDIRGAFNHSPDWILGRTAAKTMELSEDSKGLRYRITLNPADSMAASVAAKVERRDVTGSSFWFAIDSPEDERWEFDARSELPLRTLTRLRLVDVGPVAYPAYTVSTSIVRTFDPIAERERLRRQIEAAKAWRI